jgi:hypothetical protein
MDVRMYRVRASADPRWLGKSSSNFHVTTQQRHALWPGMRLTIAGIGGFRKVANNDGLDHVSVRASSSSMSLL